MAIIMLLTIGSAGVNSLLMPASPAGVITSFSLSNGAEAMFYNPANFEAKEDYSVSCFYNSFFVATKSFSLGLTKKINTLDLGVSILNYDYGEIEFRPNYPTEETLVSYSANDFSLGLCGSTNISPQGKFGLHVKYVSENLYVYSDHTFAIDLSLSYRSEQTGLALGVTNLGFKLKLKNEEVTLPARMSLGWFRYIKKVTISADLHYLVNNGEFEFGLGIGLPAGRLVELFAAINYRENFYPGCGLRLDAGRLLIKYGTAFYPFDLGMINSLGIGFNF